jgi:hypothetical protein
MMEIGQWLVLVSARYVEKNPHVLSNIWTQGLVQANADKTVGLTCEVHNLPFFPVLAPYPDSPAATSSMLDAIVIAKMRYTRVSQLCWTVWTGFETAEAFKG